MFRVLNYSGATPREISEVVNNLMNGKSNNTGTITLATGNATTTTLYDERISVDTKIILIPFSDAAEADTAPYGSFSDTTDQVATTLGAANIMSCNTTYLSSGIYVADSTKFTVRNTGTYAIQYSVQVVNSTNDVQDIDIWFRKNGNDIALTDSRFGLPSRKSSGNPSHLIAVSTFYIDLAANDYIQIVWHPSDLGVSLEHYAAVTAVPGTTPAIPASPSVIMTMQYIAPMAYSNIYVSAQQQGQATITHFANATADKTYAYILVG